MADALVLSHHSCGDDWRPLEQRLFAHLTETGLRPDIVYLVGGCEEHILAVCAGRSMLAWLRGAFPEARARLVHQGCVGLFAAAEDFRRSGHRCAVVICDESSAELSQRCLAVAGVGVGMGPDGMLAASGVGIAVLVNKPAPTADDICISDLRIYAQSGGLEGTRRLLRKMQAVYSCFEQAAVDVVSFAIHSPWSKALALDLVPGPARRPWLRSAEQGREHLMSVKPLREMELYGHRLRQGSVALVTLGLGGRIGLMRLALGAAEELLRDEATFAPVPLSVTVLPAEVSDRGRPSALRSLHSLDRAYLGIDGLYFVSDLPEESLPIFIDRDPDTVPAAPVQMILAGDHGCAA